jgi:xanthine dehydrogenase YagS FAD-binding subunit
MNKFSWYQASSVEEALKAVNSTVSESLTAKPGTGAVFKSGGIDVLDLMKEGLLQPEMIVNIREIPGLDSIEDTADGGLKIGANATLAEMMENEKIKQNYQALYQSLNHAATPQLRNMASLGGNLAQRTRCWYFRSIDHQCFRKGGSTCFAKNGMNEFHSILKNGMCSSVHSSSISTALMAFDAKVEITGSKGKQRLVDLDDFFILPGDDPSRENILRSDELIAAVILPKISSDTKSIYKKQGARESYDWALADVAIVADVKSGKCSKATMVLGAAAPVPLRIQYAADMLVNEKIDENIAKEVAEAAMERATPLEHNAYKVPLFKALIKRSVLQLA